MKKTLSLLTLTVALILSSQASAKDGFYLGADLLFANSHHQYKDRTHLAYLNNYDDTKTEDNSLGFAFDAGYKFSRNNFFVAPEIFFDQLNNSAPGFRYKEVPNNKQQSVDLNYRYGAKLNLGYNITSKFNAFLNLGMANVDYDTRMTTYRGRKMAKTELAPLFGFGVGYQITDNVLARVSYDRMNLALRSPRVGAATRFQSTLDTVKLGFVYSF